MPEKIAQTVRRALLRAAGSEALFLFAAFVSASLLTMDPLVWYAEATQMFDAYVIVPWGAALCLLRLERRARMEIAERRADLAVLFALLVWIAVPFTVRFGLTFNTACSWYNHMALFFGLYALVTEADAARFERILDASCALFAALSLALGALTLYCVLSVNTLGLEVGGLGFGLDGEDCLVYGLHYNITGMTVVCCALFSLLGFCRRKNPAVRALHLAGAALMTLATVLTQSRTSRYALLVSFAVGCYGLLSVRLPLRRTPLRHAAALCCALVVLVGGYAGAKTLTHAALSHYADVRTARLMGEVPSVPFVSTALAQEPVDEAAATAVVNAKRARAASSSTFSNRTRIWDNLLNYWKQNPKYFLIGNGMGRTGSLIVQGTGQESGGAVAVHNAYLQFAADYGLVGFALLAVFLCMCVPRTLRALLSPMAKPGDRVLVMLVVSQLLTGLMESRPLAAMSPSSLALFFALAALFVRDRALRAAALSSGRAV